MFGLEMKTLIYIAIAVVAIVVSAISFLIGRKRAKKFDQMLAVKVSINGRV